MRWPTSNQVLAEVVTLLVEVTPLAPVEAIDALEETDAPVEDASAQVQEADAQVEEAKALEEETNALEEQRHLMR